MATFEERLVESFDGANLKQIAAKMEVNYHTLRNWAKETRDIPPDALRRIAKMTKISLNWLLLEDGPKYIVPTLKTFDVEHSIEYNDDWRDVINQWYEFEGRPAPDISGASFMGGWRSFDLKMKVQAITDYKMVLDRILEKED